MEAVNVLSLYLSFYGIEELTISVYSRCLILRTGILKVKDVSPLLLFLRVMSPPRALEIEALHANPIPIE